MINKFILPVFSLLAVWASGLHATTVVLSESNGTVEVYLKNGTLISANTVSPMVNTVVGNNIAFRFGTFLGGYTPTTDNSSTWFNSANFAGVNGFVTVGGSSLGRLSGSITAGNSQAISSPVAGDSGITTNSVSIAQNAQLYAIVWNAPYVANGSGGNTFYPTTSLNYNGLQAAILTNPNWIMPLSSGTDLTQLTYSLSAGTTAVIGALDLVNKGITLETIPEPSSITLLGLSGIALVLIRARRKNVCPKGLAKTANCQMVHLFITGSFLAGSLSFAQTVSTPIVGFQKTTLSANSFKGVGIPLLNPPVISGSIASKSGKIINLTGATSLGALLEATPAAYYLEVISPTNSPSIGDRIEVDVAATKASNNGSVTLAESPRNTVGASGASLAAGTGVVIRKHVTLDQLRASISGTLYGDDNSYENADVVYFHDGVAFVPFWLGADKLSWLSNNDPDDHRYEVIAPGQGVLFYKRGSPASLTSTGAVRQNDYKQVLAQGYQISAPGFPVGYSPEGIGGSLSNGWAAGSQIMVHDGIGFGVNTLFSDGTWDDGVNPDPVNNTILISGDSSFLTYLPSPVTDVETKPIR